MNIWPPATTPELRGVLVAYCSLGYNRTALTDTLCAEIQSAVRTVQQRLM